MDARGWTRGVDARLDPDGLGLPSFVAPTSIHCLVSLLLSFLAPAEKNLREIERPKNEPIEVFTKPSTFHWKFGQMNYKI